MKYEKTILFFDDLPLNRLDNMERKIGRPKLITESVYQDPYLNAAWGYPMVYFDDSSGKWRQPYHAWEEDRSKRYPVLAESDDGLQWRPEDTTEEIDIPGRKYPHELFHMPDFSEMSRCYLDPHADPSERLKNLVVRHEENQEHSSSLWVSPDALHWRCKEGVHWQKPVPDPATFPFWNEFRQSYVLSTRPAWADRRVAVMETKNWRDFTKPELALQADAIDHPLTQPYGMPVFPYEGMYVALLWLFHVVPQVKGHSPHKFLGGHVDCQLAYSLNGWHFQRCLRDPLIPNGEIGQPDSGCVYPSFLLQKDNELWIYASACTHEHGYIPQGSGSLLAYRLRKDGFVYLQSGNGRGYVGTRPLLIRDESLFLNIQNPGGEARFQLTNSAGEPLSGYTFENSDTFRGDSVDLTPRWQDGKSLKEHVEKVVRLEIEISNGRIYALRGNFRVLTGYECRRYENFGEEPSDTPGF